MTSKLLNIFLSLAALLALAACGNSDEPQPTPEPEPEISSRTVLVYMVADNNLGSYLNSSDLKEMTEGVAQHGLNGGRLLVYHNRRYTAAGNPPLLLDITPTGIDTLKTYPDDPSIYSVEISRMREVLADMKSFAPDNDYGMIFWGHATAWMTHGSSDITESVAAPKKRSYGSDRNKWMTLSSMAEALKDEKFSFIYFDCCLMGTVEVAYELRDITPYIVASPTEVEGEGMPYSLNIPAFFATDKPDVIGMATNTFEYYNNRLSSSCQMVVIDTSTLDALADATRKVFATQTSFPLTLWDVQELSKTHSEFFRTTSPCNDCHPVYDMEDYIKAMTFDNPDLLTEWQKALDNTVLYKATTARDFTGIPVIHYCGLGSYVVRKTNHGDYHGYTLTSWWNDVVSTAPLFK